MRSALTLDLSKASFAVPVRVGVAVGGVLIVGGLLGLTDIAGFAALGALVAAFCRPDPYRVRSGRLAALGVGMVLATLVGAVIGVSGGALVTEIVVIALLAGAAAAFIASVRIAGPGAVVFVFAAASAAFTPSYQAMTPHLLPDPGDYARALAKSRIATELENGLTPALAAALAYFDTMHTARGTANMLQAQRDFFGAHGFERIDEPGAHHGPWGGHEH